ncbi:hypothetical protein AgCh_033791 [Apium graveolens]
MHSFKVDQRQMRNRYDYLRNRYAAWCSLKAKTGNHYDPTTNSFNFTEQEWIQHIQANKHVATLRTTSLIFPDLCRSLFDGAAATGVSGWGPSSKKNRSTDLNDNLEILGADDIHSQSQANSPFSGTHSNSNTTFQGTTQSNVSDTHDEGERPKKKAKSSSKPSKSSQLEDKMASALDLMIQNNSGPSLQECKEKLNKIGWESNNPLRQMALGIFCESATYRTQWMLLEEDEIEPWGAIGALDGTLIHAIVPASQQARYRGRGRGECYQNILGIYDFNMIFTFVWAGWEGVAHDSRLLTEVVADIDSGFPLPPPNKYYLCDAAYANTRGFLTPYKNTRYWQSDFRGRRALTREEKFNHAHAQLRNVTERAYGVLKARFPILKQMPPYTFSTQRDIAIACFAVHNFIRLQKLEDELFDQCDNNVSSDSDGEENEAMVEETEDEVQRTSQGTQFMSSLLENSNESGSAAYGLPGKANRPRNISRSSRDGTRSSSKAVISSPGVHTFLPSQNATRDAYRLVNSYQRDYDVRLKSILRSTSPNNNSLLKKKRLGRFEVAGGVQSLQSKIDMARGGLRDASTDAKASNSFLDNQYNQYLESGSGITPVNKGQLEESQEVHERVNLAGHKCASSLANTKVNDPVTFGQMNELNDHQIGNAVFGTRGLDSESSCNQTNLIIERNCEGRICTNIRTGDSNEKGNQEIVTFEETNVAIVEDTCDFTSDENDSFREQESGSILTNKLALKENVLGSLIEMKDQVFTVGVVPDAITAQKNERMPNSLLDSSSLAENANACTSKLQVITESSIQATLDPKLSPRVSAILPESQSCPQETSNLATKECEDLILKEARLIECKRFTDLSLHTLSLEERIWKISVAAQIGHEATAAFQIKSHEQKSCRRQKEVAHNLAEAVVNLWRGIAVVLDLSLQVFAQKNKFMRLIDD